MASTTTDPHKALRDDVRLLGELLGETLRRQEGQRLFERVERVRALAKRARQAGGESDTLEALAAELRSMPVSAALPIARSFAHFLNLANVAEQYHRVRRRRAYQRDPRARPQPASIEETLPRLLSGAGEPGCTPETLHAAVCNLRIELVMTAHPTEIMRRSLQHKYSRIAHALATIDHTDATCLERETSIEDMRREITAAWETEEVRRERPSPLDEVRGALAVFEETIWDALPQYCRSLDRALRQATGRGLPIGAAPIRFGSWIGGDRDGNPFVTPEVTRRACLMARWTALSLYAREVEQLRFELSMADANAELLDRVDGAHEPYRAILRALQQRVEASKQSVEALLKAPDHGTAYTGYAGETGYTWQPEQFESAADFAEPLLLCHRSLHETGNGIIAEGRLTDVLRRLDAFGLTLVRLDIRQEAERHTEAIDAITRALGLGEYGCWSEPRRVDFLTNVLAQDRRLMPSRVAATPRVAEVFDTFRMMAAIHPESLGAYIITMAGRPSDVLAVELLQREAGVRPARRVVPLFETSRDLAAAAPMVDALLSIPWYRNRVMSSEGRLEVMVGYSDSAKDVGRFAAAWDLFKAQEAIVSASRAHGVPITLFHGRGGSVGRGGGPTHLAIRSQPPGSVDGTLRVTEQGEMIQAKFGLIGIALRTLEVYTTATLEATLATPAPADAAWRTTMDRVSAAARDAFRGTVYGDPRFLPYFNTATPVAELDAMHIGSRPAKRDSQAALQALRAIPWQFAWMQTRLLLPSWLGIEEAVGDDERAMCREMYRSWPFFRSTIELLEMALAKADADIAAYYDRQLVPPEQQDLGLALRGRLQRAIEVVLDITGHRHLLENNPVLRRSIDVRNPYVDPINLLQVELLRRLRSASESHSEDEARLRRALLVTINGVAAGMRNTG